jgi:hypothetical protein
MTGPLQLRIGATGSISWGRAIRRSPTSASPDRGEGFRRVPMPPYRSGVPSNPSDPHEATRVNNIEVCQQTVIPADSHDGRRDRALVQRYYAQEFTLTELCNHRIDLLDVWLRNYRLDHPGDPVPDARLKQAALLKEWVKAVRAMPKDE